MMHVLTATEELKPCTCQHRLFCTGRSKQELKTQALKPARGATTNGKQPAPFPGQPLVSVRSPPRSKGSAAPSLCTGTRGSRRSCGDHRLRSNYYLASGGAGWEAWDVPSRDRDLQTVDQRGWYRSDKEEASSELVPNSVSSPPPSRS